MIVETTGPFVGRWVDCDGVHVTVSTDCFREAAGTSVVLDIDLGQPVDGDGTAADLTPEQAEEIGAVLIRAASAARAGQQYDAPTSRANENATTEPREGER